MLLVETELRPSPIHGIGVFLLQPVSRGELIWRFDSRIDRVYTEEEIATLPERMKRFLRTYSTWHEPTALTRSKETCCCAPSLPHRRQAAADQPRFSTVLCIMRWMDSLTLLRHDTLSPRKGGTLKSRP